MFGSVCFLGGEENFKELTIPKLGVGGGGVSWFVHIFFFFKFNIYLPSHSHPMIGSTITLFFIYLLYSNLILIKILLVSTITNNFYTPSRHS